MTVRNINPKKMWIDLAYGVILGLAFLLGLLVDVLGGGLTSLALLYTTSISFSLVTIGLNMTSVGLSLQNVYKAVKNKYKIISSLLDLLATVSRAATPIITFILLLLPVIFSHLPITFLTRLLSVSPLLMIGASMLVAISNIIQAAYHVWQSNKADTTPEKRREHYMLIMKYSIDAIIGVAIATCFTLLLLTGLGATAFISLIIATGCLLIAGSIISFTSSILINKQLEKISTNNEPNMDEPDFDEPTEQMNLLRPLFDKDTTLSKAHSNYSVSSLILNESDAEEKIPRLTTSHPGTYDEEKYQISASHIRI